jgi:hypothetical protein
VRTWAFGVPGGVRPGLRAFSIALPQAVYRGTTETGDGATRVSVPRDDSSPHLVSARTSDGSITAGTAN